MFKLSIKNNSKFLTPFLQGIKLYGSDDILSNVGTMIIINEDGTLLTCKHIAEEIINSQILLESYPRLLKQLNNLSDNEKKKFEKDNNVSNNTCVLSIIKWFFEVKNEINFQVILHPTLDLAIIKFNKIKFKIDNYPKFSEQLPEQGQSVCKLGYAFPNIDFFRYDLNKNIITTKEEGNLELPLFPMDGIVTRHINLDTGKERYDNVWFETSSPGLRGQSGGPIFGPDGLIYGIQSFTSHMDLNFDINTNVRRGNEIKEVSVNSFINLGVGISSVEIIKFLEDNNIKYYK